MTQCFELFDSSSSLFVGVVSSADSPHTRRFVAGVALSTVVEIRVGTTGTISDNLSGLSISGAKNRNVFTYTQMLPVIAICGHR